MGVVSWIVWAALTIAVAAASLRHYRRRETPGRGRTVLAVLRAAAICILLLLIFDPVLPATGGRRSRGTQVLLDASLSMTIPADDTGATRWDRAREIARDRAGDRPILLFGVRPRPANPDSLPATAPADARSELLPALHAAAEAGVRRVVVVTDGAIEDAEEVARWAARLGVEIETVQVGGAVANRTLSEASAPAWVESGQPTVIEYGVAGATGDSTHVLARRDGRVVGRASVTGAGPGRLATGQLQLTLDPPAGGGWVRLELALEGTDPVPDDDVRTVYVHVSDEPAGIALVSLHPDWEPRFLAPVLQRSLGLPLRAWIRGATGQYVRVAGGLEAGAMAGDAEVRRAVERAELVVLHGVGADAPAWVIAALTSSRRLMVFPRDTRDRIPLPLDISVEQPGDYYLYDAIPPSPVAPLLAGIELTAAAPLSGLRSAELPPTGWAPLLATRGRQGSRLPIAAAAEESGRRWVVALGTGYWNWAFRGDSERAAYERLWGSLAGWLIRQRGTASLAAVRPAALAWPRGIPVPWLAPGLRPDSIRVVLGDSAGATVQDTTVLTTVADTAFTSAPQPGHYSYRATAFAGDTITQADGVLSLETYSAELSRRPVDMAAIEGDGSLVRSDDGGRRGTPLHATAYPYVLLLGCLAAEWILRRRWGLR